MKNPYLPIPMIVKGTQIETSDRMLRTLELAFVNEEDGRPSVSSRDNSASSRFSERGKPPLESLPLPRKKVL